MAAIKSEIELYSELKRIISTNLDGQRVVNGPVERALSWLNKLNLEFSLGTLQGLDLACPLSIGDERHSFWKKFRRFVKLKWACKLYYLVVVVLIYASVATVLNLRFQYIYDANKTIVKRITDQLMGKSRYSFRLNNRNGSQFLDEIEARAGAARARLKSLGAAHVEWSFGSEIMYIYVLVPSLIFILIGPSLMKFHGLGYFSWTRWLFDEDGERRLCARLVLLEIGKFEQLMLLAAKIDFSADKVNLNRLRFAPTKSESRRASVTSLISNTVDWPESANRPRFNDIIQNELLVRGDLMQHRHLTASRQLQFIALGGRLGALQRTRNYLVSMSSQMMLLVVAQSVYMTILTLWTYNRMRLLFIKHGKQTEFLTLKDYIETSCLMYFVLVCCFVCVTVKAYNLVTAHDQVKAVNRLNTLIRDTLSYNEHAFRGLMQGKARRASSISSRSSRQFRYRKWSACSIVTRSEKIGNCLDETGDNVPSLLNRLELELLTVIVEYRLFVSLYQLAMRPARLYGPFYLYLILSLALLIRIHAAYLHPELKVLGAYSSCFFMAPQYVYLVHLCYSHQRCLDSYKALYSLVAQLSYYETVLNLRGCISLRMAILTLKRCLIRPEHAEAKFACRIMFLAATYSTMLKVTFWLSLLMIPMLNLKQTNEDVVSNLLSDPFGIFNFK